MYFNIDILKGTELEDAEGTVGYRAREVEGTVSYRTREVESTAVCYHAREVEGTADYRARLLEKKSSGSPDARYQSREQLVIPSAVAPYSLWQLLSLQLLHPTASSSYCPFSCS